MIASGTYGTPNWVELVTPDVEAAIAFYGPLLGWSITRGGTAEGTYATATVGDLDVAGMLEHVPTQGVPPTWTVFLHVEDVDETAEVVRAAGGAVLRPVADLPAARVGVVTDPTGGTFGIGGGRGPAGTYLDQGAGTVSWIELLTRDPRTAEPFYATVFGWRADTDPQGEVAYTVFSLDDEPVAGMMMMPDEVPAEVPAYWFVYFAVYDLEAAVARTLELGGGVIAPPMGAGEGRFVVLEDAQGAVFGLLEFPVTE